MFSRAIKGEANGNNTSPKILRLRRFIAEMRNQQLYRVRLSITIPAACVRNAYALGATNLVPSAPPLQPGAKDHTLLLKWWRPFMVRAIGCGRLH